MHVVFSYTGGTGSIRDWADDNTGSDIAISAVPEISYSTLPRICAGSLMLRRHRSEGGARMVCAIRSYLSTTRKHGFNLMDAIKSAFAGQPLDFAPE